MLWRLISAPGVEEAISFGAANYRSIEKVLDSRYAFGSAEDFGEGGVVHTKWYKLAFMSAQKAEKGGSLSAPEQAEIFSDPCLQINIKVYGRSLDFAKDYQVTLLQDSKVIKPEKMHADSFISDAAAKNSMPGFPGYWAIMRSYFDMMRSIRLHPPSGPEKKWQGNRFPSISSTINNGDET